MTRARSLVIAMAAVALSLSRAGLALAQDPQPAPAPAAAAPATPAAPAVDSNELYVGEWDWTAQLRDSSISGLWRISYANGRFTGTVVLATPGMPPSPVSAMSVRDHFRNFSLTTYFNGDPFTFSGHLDNPRNVNGTMSTRGGMGRLRAQKRG
jgi:hypothetical protein